MALSPWQPLSGRRVLRIPRLDRRAHESSEGEMLKVCTVNVGTMKGRGREIANMLHRRGADICCVQEVRYKGGSSMTIGDGDEKFKFWYSGNCVGSNGVGIFVKQNLAENVIEVNRCSDRIMKIKIVLGKTVYHVYSAYAPQVGRPTREKDAFFEELEDELVTVPDTEGLIVGGDFNCHIGNERSGYEDVMGRYGFGTANAEGVALLDLCKNQGLKICNTLFRKDREKLITYKSGSAETQIDFILVKPVTGQSVMNCKVIPGEACLTQHRLLRADLRLRKFKRKQWKGEKKIKLWKLKDVNLQRQFEVKVQEATRDGDKDWPTVASAIRVAAEQTCGRTSGHRVEQRETWWWNEEVQEAIKQKKESFSQWQRTGRAQDKHLYRVSNNRAKRAVTAAKRLAWTDWSNGLHTTEGKQKMFKVAKQIRKDKKDIVGSNYIRDTDGTIKIDEQEAAERWRGYFEVLLNEENANVIEDEEMVLGPIKQIELDEINTALSFMKSDKAAGPSAVTADMIKYAGETGAIALRDIFRKILYEEKAPVEWGDSLTIPLFKGKGDALECGKYRGLRLLEHSMKIYERILLNRLKMIVKVDEQQCGFTSGKSTTDAIFMVRMLQEKYCRKKKKLYLVFVDLEKAFDKVPRKAIRWALRRQLVPEKLINQVMCLYEHSTSRAKFAGKTSQSFDVSVGVHQGSALSPLLFNLVLEETTKSCRKGCPWELLYADDLVLMAESREEVLSMFEKWREALEKRGLKVNLGKTKLLVSGKEYEVEETGKYPCGVCKTGVGNYSAILCTECNKWCHKRCSGLRSLDGVNNYRCPTCVTGRAMVEMDESLVVEGGIIEEVTHFCYLGDLLDRSGGAERAMKTRISAAWSKWRELAGLLTNAGIPLLYRARVYEACVRSVMLYASETWAMTKKMEDFVLKADRRMLRNMAGIRLRDRVSSEVVLDRCKLKSINQQLYKRRLNWFGHVARRSLEEPLGFVYSMEIPGRLPPGRPRKTWRGSVQDLLDRAGVTEDAALERSTWNVVVTSLTSS